MTVAISPASAATSRRPGPYECAKRYAASVWPAADRAVLGWANVGRERDPDAGAGGEPDLHEGRAFYDGPAAHRRMVRTTNPSARRLREVRRRTDARGTFRNAARRERIV